MGSTPFYSKEQGSNRAPRVVLGDCLQRDIPSTHPECLIRLPVPPHLVEYISFFKLPTSDYTPKLELTQIVWITRFVNCPCPLADIEPLYPTVRTLRVALPFDLVPDFLADPAFSDKRLHLVVCVFRFQRQRIGLWLQQKRIHSFIA